MGKAIILSGGSRAQDLTTRKENVLAGKTYGGADADLDPGTGIMPDRGAVNASLDCGKSTTIPSGYHNGGGIIRANALSGQTPASASAGQIISGYSGWANGAKVPGSVADRGNLQNGGFGAAGDYIAINVIPEGWYHGSPRVQVPTVSLMSAIGITADKLKKGVSIGGVTGNFEGFTDSPLLLHTNKETGPMVDDSYRYPYSYSFPTTNMSINSSDDPWDTSNEANDTGWHHSPGYVSLTAYNKLKISLGQYRQYKVNHGWEYYETVLASEGHNVCGGIMDLNGNIVRSTGEVGYGEYELDCSGLSGNYYIAWKKVSQKWYHAWVDIHEAILYA